jgi:hypothetical protein
MTDLADKLRELREAGHIAQQSDMKELLTSTSHGNVESTRQQFVTEA